MRKTTFFLAVFLWSFMWGFSPAAALADSPLVLVVPKVESGHYWGRVRQGALDGGAARGARVIYRGPLGLEEPRAQEAIIRDGVADKVDAIVIAPTHAAKLAGALGRAREAGIAVVVIDSPLQGDGYGSLIATDNEAAGREAADFLLSRVRPGVDPILLLRFQEGNASTVEREQGFADRVAARTGGEGLITSEYIGVSEGNAYHRILALLRAHPEVRAVFAPAEAVTLACILAVRELGLSGKVVVVGFDSTPKVREALGEGLLSAVMVQQPYRMGYLGVTTACDILDGRPAPGRIVTGARLVTLAEDLEAEKP